LIENDELKITKITFLESFEKDTDKFQFQKYSGNFESEVIEYLNIIVGYKPFEIYKEVKNDDLGWILIEYKSNI
jgi:hypothetical protein